MNSALLAGVDVGTSSVKLVACTSAGQVVANQTAAYGLSTPRPDWVEQDTREVVAVVFEALTALAVAARSHGQIVAVGFSTTMHGIVPVEADGTPLGPLITWMDRRSDPVAQRWRNDGTGPELYRRTGAPIHPMLPSCKLAWLAEQHDAIYARAARLVSLKELLIHRLVGEWLVDWSIASATGLFSLTTRDWDEFALDRAGVDRARLATVVPIVTARPIRVAAARELGLDPSTQIVVGSSDGALSNLGVGAIGSDDAALSIGTSGAVRVIAPEAILDERGRTFCYAVDEQNYLVGGATNGGGAVLEHLSGLFYSDVAPDRRDDRSFDDAAQIGVGADGITVLPFLGGERAPYWRGDLQGSIFGLDLSHGRAQIARAGYEGVIFALFSVYQILRERLGAVKRIRLSGGLSHRPLLQHLIADVFTTPVAFTEPSEAAAFGAALVAGVGIGAIGSLTDAAKRIACTRELAPEPRDAAAYRHAYERYCRCAAAVLGLADA